MGSSSRKGQGAALAKCRCREELRSVEANPKPGLGKSRSLIQCRKKKVFRFRIIFKGSEIRRGQFQP